jgi:hypothetical protein
MMTREIPMLDLTKPVTTRDGRPVRILCTDRKGTDYPVTALITAQQGTEVVFHYTHEGRGYRTHESDYDLINPKQKLYMLVWKAGADAKYVAAQYDNDADRTTAIALCKKQGWKVNKTFEIEVD